MRMIDLITSAVLIFLVMGLVGTIERNGNTDTIISIVFYILVALAILNREAIYNYLKNPEK